ncbi:MAG: SMP-30/gluconolactonase/LRE family protein [Planctomycetota bacterium]
MKFLPLLAVLVSIGLAGHAAADDASIIPEDVKIEVVSQGDYRFVEGPALASDGSIFFSDIPNHSIHRYDPETGETTLVTDDSGGGNGLMFMSDGKLMVCEARTGRRVGVYLLNDKHSDGPVLMSTTPRNFNGPNDIALTRDGQTAYFTDPNYANRDDALPIEGVYRLNLAIQGASSPGMIPFEAVIDDLKRPNGIGISADQQTLYVADNGDKKIWAYPILESGQVGEGWLLNDLGDYEKGPDGMTVDHLGRIYTTIFNEGVLILSPEGERLGFLRTGPQTTNCVFGADGKTLYITAEKSLKRAVLNTGK